MCKSAGLLAVLISITVSSLASAQLSEFRISQYVPGDVVAAFTINVKAIRDQLDISSEDHQFLIRKFQEESGIDLTQLDRVVATFGFEYLTGDQSDPGGLFLIELEFSHNVNQADILEALYDAESMDEVNVDGHTIFCPTGRSGGAPSVCFADEHRMLIGYTERIKRAFEQPDNDFGPMLVNSMEAQADLVFVMDISLLDGDQRSEFSRIFAEDMAIPYLNEAIDGNLESGEIIVTAKDSTPVNAVVRFETDQAAANWQQRIEAGLAAVPQLVDNAQRELPDDSAPYYQVTKSFLEFSTAAVASASVTSRGPVLQFHLEHDGGFPESPQLLSGYLVAWFRFFDELQAQFGGDEVIIDDK